MTNNTTAPLIFYDISSPLQPRSFAPNPSKTRLALTFKNLSFTTNFIDILSIPSVRKSLSCPATRKLDDGTDYYTLPMLRDPSSGAVWGDTFAIANALDTYFPDSGGGLLFPKNSTHTGLNYVSPHKDTPFYAPITTNAETSANAAYALFNLHVDATFSGNMILIGAQMPFNPDTADETRAMFAKRAHLRSWEDLKCEGEAKVQAKEKFKESLESLAEFFQVHNEGPFLEGKEPNYADFIVGGWLNHFAMLMPGEEWREVAGWHGGVFGRLHDVLQERYFVCT